MDCRSQFPPWWDANQNRLPPATRIVITWVLFGKNRVARHRWNAWIDEVMIHVHNTNGGMRRVKSDEGMTSILFILIFLKKKKKFRLRLFYGVAE